LKDLAFMAASCSHVLAWVAFAVLAFVPVYQGVEVTPTVSRPRGATAAPRELVRTEPEQVTTYTTSTLIEVNGWGVLPIILFPVAFSGAGLMGVIVVVRGRVLRRIPLGISALLLLAFCIAGSSSIGIFYLPAALAMSVSAAIGLIQRREVPQETAVNP